MGGRHRRFIGSIALAMVAMALALVLWPVARASAEGNEDLAVYVSAEGNDEMLETFVGALEYHGIEVADAAVIDHRNAQDVAGLLLKLQQQGLDPVYFSKYARAQTRTFAEWKALDWRALYHRANFDIDVV